MKKTNELAQETLGRLIGALQAKDLDLASDAEIAKLVELGTAALEIQDRRRAEFANRRRESYERRCARPQGQGG